MRPDALTEQNAQIWTSGQLGQVLGRHASEGLVVPPEPIEQKSAFVTLAEELTGSSSQLTERGIQALMSGTRTGYGANTTFHEHPTYGEDPEEEERKKNREFRSNQAFAQNMQTFNVGGINMTEKEASSNLLSAQKRLLKTQESNTEAARVNVTKEEFKELSKIDDTCVLVDGRPIEDITLVDGHFVDTNLYYEMEIENQELSEQYARAEAFSVQVETGNMTWEQAPQDIQDLVAEEHRLRNEDPQPQPAPDQPSVLEQLENMQSGIDATMQPAISVKPSVSYSQLSPL